MTEQLTEPRSTATPTSACTAARCAALLAQLRPLVESPSPEATATIGAAFDLVKGLGAQDACPESVECLLSIAHYYYLSTDCVRGLAAAAEAVDQARAREDKALARKALTYCGVMRMETGDIAGAIEIDAEAIALARELGAAEQEAPVWNNLGIALLAAGQPADALRCFQRACDIEGGLPESAEQWAVRYQSLTNIGTCALHLHDIATGLRAVQLSITLNANPTSAHACLSRVLAESNYVRLLLRAGDLESAQRRVDQIRRFAAKVPSPRAEYSAWIATGLVEIHTGQVDLGLTRLKRALERARKDVRHDVRDALAGCIEGYEAAGQSDVALVYLHELLAMNRAARAAQLLAPFEALAAELANDGGSDLRLDQVMTGQAAKLAASIDKCVGDLVASAVNNALRAGHDSLRIFRVARLAELFALSLDWASAGAGELAFAVRLMDVGSSAVPDALLRKPRGLSAGEKRLVAEHTGFGAELLQRARLAVLQPCIEAAKFHHERWDSTGPWGLRGEAIPIAARIAALSDTLDALTHARPWRPAMTIQAALEEIAAGAGRQFDPVLAQRFVEFVKAEYWRCRNWDEHLAVEGHEHAYVKALGLLDRLIASGGEA